MGYEKFVKAEERGRERWKEEKKEVNEQEKRRIKLYRKDDQEYARINYIERVLPINNPISICETQTAKKEYLVYNERVALIFNTYAEIVGFFRLPNTVSTAIVYYGEGLFAAISKKRDEIISFTFKESAPETGFSIGNYYVCARLENGEEIYADEEYLYVLHANGVFVLKPM